MQARDKAALPVGPQAQIQLQLEVDCATGSFEQPDSTGGSLDTETVPMTVSMGQLSESVVRFKFDVNLVFNLRLTINFKLKLDSESRLAALAAST